MNTKNKKKSKISFNNLPEDAIAIVGLSFRFPGDLSDEHALWQALVTGQDMVTEIPADRWAVDELQHDKRAEPGKSITFAAGVLSDIDKFDAEFFGISPREASMLDPQQRLLLEMSWEAMENAGKSPSNLAGGDCAVYVGISGLDYGIRGLDDLPTMTAHSMTGNTLSVAANRISYVFDLHGPSLAVDTACSSSMVALHHACTCLLSGQSSMALVGGVNMLLHPYPFVGFTKASMLSASGRCRVFDAGGDGYVRSEGGAVLLLKRLQDAVTDGDNIQAVIRATGVNADGGRKTGITIPSYEGQADLMQAVLKKAGVSPEDVDFIEAHGTGTMVGDPIEAFAIGSVYGVQRTHALPIGSVKANLGHLESASGMAGLVKTILALKYRELPPALHLETPNPNIDFSALNLELVRELKPLKKKAGQPLIAGLNSFGFGGANAHVILQSYSAEPQADRLKPPPSQVPMVLSARSEGALQALAQRYADLLQSHPDVELYDIAYSAIYQREMLNKRLIVPAGTREQVINRLLAYANHDEDSGCYYEDALTGKPQLAFVYSGNGAQWHGMGCKLLKESTLFRKVVTEVDAYVQIYAGFSVIEMMNLPEAENPLDDTEIAQPLLFAVQVGLTALLLETGIRPDATAGHSVGEVAAAWAAGALDLHQATRVICARSAAQALTHGSGTMAAIGMSANGAQAVIDAMDGELDITVAGVNSPKNVTVSGSVDDIIRLQNVLKSRQVFFKKLDLDYAFHTHHMDPIQSTLDNALNQLHLQPTRHTRFISTVTGEECEGTKLDSHYWWLNIREPVLFDAAIQCMANSGCKVFVEIGPNPILQRYISESIEVIGVHSRVLPTMRKHADSHEAVVESVWRSMLLAQNFDWAYWFPVAGDACRLPNYPWQRERHWHAQSSEGLKYIERRRVHPLLGWKLTDAESSWENTIDPQMLPWLADHKVGGAIVYPGAAYVEMALAAAYQVYPGDRLLIEDLEIISPLVFDGEHARTLRLVLNQRDRSFYIQSKQRLSDDGWVLHCAGRILEPSKSYLKSEMSEIDQALWTVGASDHYALAACLGLDYGPAFQGLKLSRVTEDRLDAYIEAPECLSLDGYYLHPALLDVCYQSLVDFYEAEINRGQGVTLLPTKTGRLEILLNRVPATFRAKKAKQIGRSVVADFELFDIDGAVVAKLNDCRFRVAPLSLVHRHQAHYWDVVPVLQPHAMASYYSGFPEVSALLKSASLLPVSSERHKWFNETLPLLEALTTSFIYQGVQQVLHSKATTLKALTQSETPYVLWMLSVLEKEGLLVLQQDGHWQLDESQAPPDAMAIWQALFKDSPECLPQLTLIGRMGMHVHSVLLGEQDISSLNHSLWSTSLVESLYDADPCYAGVNDALLELLRSCIQSQPKHKKTRILEISPVPSALLSQVISEFGRDRFDYFLGISQESYLATLQSELQLFPHVQVQYFDPLNWRNIETTFDESMFDVVIIKHVLHQTQFATQALQQVKQWLSPGGVILIAERYPDLSADFMYGLAPLWWVKQTTSDTARLSQYNSSLYSPQAWQLALEQVAYVQTEVWHEPASESFSEGVYLLAAKRSVQEAVDPPNVATQSWRIVADKTTQDWAEHIALMLQANAQDVEICDAILLSDTHRVENIVWMVGWEQSVEKASSLIAEGVAMVNTLSSSRATPRLWVITQGGALSSVAESFECSPLQSAIWGWARVVMNEYPQLRCKLIDCNLDIGASYAVACLKNELLYPDASDEVVLEGEARYSLRLHEVSPPVVVNTSEDARYKLDFYVPGQLRNLVWIPIVELELLPHEVEVQTKAAGLNFRDVMYLMGMLPDEAVEQGFAGASLGLELAGVVTRVGEAVRNFSPGDAVMGFGSSCFSSHVVTEDIALAHIPKTWSYEAAATVPTVFFTVYYALKHLANLQSGERVLIHGAAGGVGLAAIQLAQHLGAEVFATAGSQEKRELITLLGADHVLDSRSLDFADEIMAKTQGQGVDVILNSLAGEAIRRNLKLLRPFGRFLELGKRDFFENTPVGLRPFKDNISYYGIDADQLLTAKPHLASQLFNELMGLFELGVLSPLPYRSFTTEHIIDAFRFMQQSKQIGKVVVRLSDAEPELSVHSETPPAPKLSGEYTWLVTGGLSGFGAESAKWLAQHGVKHLLLVSRRGMQSSGAESLVTELAAYGVQVVVKSIDVTDEKAMAAVIEMARKSMPPLRGVLHAAASYADQLMTSLDLDSVAQVIQPKLLGAWHLHNLTVDMPLDHFILYSSVTTLIGNPGQANYVAANAGLEGLSRYRSSLGLPVACIGWGPIADAGYLARHATVKEGLEQRMGKPPVSANLALAELARMLQNPAAVRTIANFDWRVLSKYLPSSGSQRFADLKHLLSQQIGAEDELDIKALVEGKPEHEVRGVIVSMVTFEVSQILCISPEKIDIIKPLHDIGLDSLMAVELALGLERKVGIQLPVMLLNDSPTVERVANLIVNKLISSDESPVEDTTHVMVQQLASQHGEQVSEAELLTFVEDVRIAGRGSKI